MRPRPPRRARPSPSRGRRALRPARSPRYRARSGAAASGDISITELHGDVVGRAQAAGEPRGPGGRQDVVRRDAVVAERHRGPVPEEHGAGVAHLRQERVGVGHAAAAGARPRGRSTTSTAWSRSRTRISFVCADRLLDDLAPAGLRELLLEGGVDLLDQRRVRRQEVRAGVRVVLGLRDQVERGHARVDVAVGDDRELGRPGEAVDPDEPGDLPLGLGDVDVAGPDDAVDRAGSTRCRRPWPRPPGRRRSWRRAWRPPFRPRTARAAGIEPSVCGGVHTHDLLDAGDHRGHDGHRDGRGVARPGRRARSSRSVRSGRTISPKRTPSRSSHHSRGSLALARGRAAARSGRRAPACRSSGVSRSARANSSSSTRIAASERSAPSNSCGELDQHLVALDEDALEDLADGLGRGGVDLEPGGLEPPAPLAQVEEREHQDSSATPGCSVVSAGASTAAAPRPHDPPADAHRARGDREGHQRQEEGRSRGPWKGVRVPKHPPRRPRADRPWDRAEIPLRCRSRRRSVPSGTSRLRARRRTSRRRAAPRDRSRRRAQVGELERVGADVARLAVGEDQHGRSLGREPDHLRGPAGEASAVAVDRQPAVRPDRQTPAVVDRRAVVERAAPGEPRRDRAPS